MLLRRSHVQDTNFPGANQSPDKMELHVDVLTPRRAAWIVRDRFRAFNIAENIYTLIPVRAGCRHTNTALVNNASLDASHRTTYSAYCFTISRGHTLLRTTFPANGCVIQHHCHTRHGPSVIRCRRVIRLRQFLRKTLETLHTGLSMGLSWKKAEFA